MSFSIGADPEFFLSRGGLPVSAFDLVPGTKTEPMPVPFGAIQHDGTAAEFNIEPVADPDSFVHHMNSVRSFITKLTNTEFLDSVTVDWGPELFDMPEEAFELGCEPDLNAYTREENPTPNMKSTMRTAGGHIHIGGFPIDSYEWPEDYEKDMFRLGRLMDHYLGVYSILWDKDHRRRELYGNPGAMRLKPAYGMEYRTLSNKWISGDDLMRFVFERTEEAVEALKRGEDSDDRAADIIATNDVAELQRVYPAEVLAHPALRKMEN